MSTQIFVNGLYLEFYIHIFTLTLVNLPDTYSKFTTPTYLYYKSTSSQEILIPVNPTEAAINKLTKTMTAIMSQLDKKEEEESSKETNTESKEDFEDEELDE
ncbi:10342_t:CDS:2 [Diversispora eburnea]|uniref:10342_t:CDS:1 n=1 Tax=Diversispora eburnea TaxID=1213867 RepID=A0A9N9B3R6_9GLOM|nr:10342_t:CDS:2 [Diversispora eburnea]